MQIHVTGEHAFPQYDALVLHVRVLIPRELADCAHTVSRIEVHLSGESLLLPDEPRKHRCMMEARRAGCEPLAVTHHAANLHQAIDGATEKLRRALGAAPAP